MVHFDIIMSAYKQHMQIECEHTYDNNNRPEDALPYNMYESHVICSG